MKIKKGFVLVCDRCGASVEIPGTTPEGVWTEIMCNGELIHALGWADGVCGQTLCPECAKKFDAWFDQFMRRGSDE